MHKLDSSGLTALQCTAEGTGVRLPFLDQRTKIRRTQVSQTVSKQRRVAGAGAQSKRRGHMTAGLSYNDLFFSQNTRTPHPHITPFTSGYCTSTVAVDNRVN